MDQPKQGGFDMSKLENGDKLVVLGAALYFIWVFIPVRYKCCSVFGFSANVGSVSGFRGVLIISWILSIVAIVEVAITKGAGQGDKLPAPRGPTHLGVAAAALIFTLLGLVAKTTGLTLSWGIFVGLIFNLVWLWGAYQIYTATQTSTPPPAPGTDTMS